MVWPGAEGADPPTCRQHDVMVTPARAGTRCRVACSGWLEERGGGPHLVASQWRAVAGECSGSRRDGVPVVLRRRRANDWTRDVVVQPMAWSSWLGAARSDEEGRPEKWNSGEIQNRRCRRFPVREDGKKEWEEAPERGESTRPKIGGAGAPCGRRWAPNRGGDHDLRRGISRERGRGWGGKVGEVNEESEARRMGETGGLGGAVEEE